MQGSGTRRSVGPLGAYALCVGSAVGVTIFGVVSQAFQIAGPGLLIALLIAAVPFFFWTTNKAFLASAVPTDGASYAWTARFVHPYVGFIITWLVFIGDVMALVLLPFVLFQYFASQLGFLDMRVFIGIILAVFFVINVLGIRLTTTVQMVLIFVAMALMVVFILLGLGGMNGAHFAPFIPNGFGSLLVAAAVLIGLYEGIGAAIEVGDEVISARQTLPKVVYLGLGSVVVLAGLLFLVAVGNQGAKLIGESAPILSVAAGRVGIGAAELIILPAVALAILTTVNAIFVASSRRVFSMARDGLLPNAFAHVSRYGTPDVTLLAVFIGSLIAIFLPLTVLLLVLGVVVPGLLRYGGIALSVLLSSKHPDIVARARMKITPVWLKVSGALGLIGAVIFIIAGYSASALSYEILLGWAAVGTVWYLLAARRAFRPVAIGEDAQSPEVAKGTA